MNAMAEFAPGVARQLTPLVRRVVAPNPGVMTGPGTNTYLVGGDQVVVIDPGPDDDSHLDAIAAAGTVTTIVVTHTHSDHWPGVPGLRDRTGAQVLGFGARDGFEPDDVLADGDAVTGPGFVLRAVHTPGHASNHLCFLLEQERLLFSGDHIMSGSTVVIAPPDGDMAAYLRALARLRAMDIAAIAPAHGGLIDDPVAKIDEYVTHRLAREAAIESALERLGVATVEQVVEAVYTDVAPSLHPIAKFSVWAHLRKLADDGRAAGFDVDDVETSWEPRGAPA